MTSTNINGYNPLSANTLFHFTSSVENLLSILQYGFKPRYCLEDYSIFGIGELAIPMTCFCDIPLSQIRNHISTYGHYAIGLRKEWGIRNGISPIMYTYEDSESTKMLNENLMMLHRGETEQVHKYIVEASSNSDRNFPAALLVESISRQSAFLAYTKLYQGKFWRDGNYLHDLVRFYDEREWRFVPKLQDTMLKNVKSHIAKSSYLDTFRLNEENEKLQSNFKLDFTPNDIRYIVVNYESEILSMVDKISKIKAGFSDDQRKVVKTRIISMQQILEDF